MRRGKSNLFRLTGLLLVALLPLVGAFISVLDMEPEDGRCRVESHHYPGTHGFPHNHLICIQQAASHWVQTEGTPATPLVVEIRLPSTCQALAPVHSTRPHLPRSRAPPQI